MEEFNLDAIDQTFTRFKVGAKVNATVVSKLKDGILLNIGGKKDGFIPYTEQEMPAIEGLKEGNSFEAIITSTKDESGCIILSKKKADDLRIGNEIINNLHVGDTADFIITKANKFGLVSNLGSFEVFIPYSQISNKRVDNNLENYVNKQFKAIILEIDIMNKKIVASIRAFEENEKQNAETAFWSAIFENKVVSGKVVRITDFGAFVNVSGVDCLVHNSEVSYERDKKAGDVLKIDETYNFKVISCDKENKKVSLSYKALQPNPVKEKISKLKVDDVVTGTVKKILPFGAIISFGDGLEGMLHVKEASHFYVKNIYEVAKVGQTLELKIINIDVDNCKVSLSLKAMQEEPDVLKLAKESSNLSNDKAEIVYSTDNPNNQE